MVYSSHLFVLIFCPVDYPALLDDFSLKLVGVTNSTIRKTGYAARKLRCIDLAWKLEGRVNDCTFSFEKNPTLPTRFHIDSLLCTIRTLRHKLCSVSGELRTNPVSMARASCAIYTQNAAASTQPAAFFKVSLRRITDQS